MVRLATVTISLAIVALLFWLMVTATQYERPYEPATVPTESTPGRS
jgi:signal peptidase I